MTSEITTKYWQHCDINHQTLAMTALQPSISHVSRCLPLRVMVVEGLSRGGTSTLVWYWARISWRPWPFGPITYLCCFLFTSTDTWIKITHLNQNNTPPVINGYLKLAITSSPSQYWAHFSSMLWPQQSAITFSYRHILAGDEANTINIP